MAERTLQILPGGQSAAPYTYPVPASTSFTLLGVRANFDGSGAGGDFLPCVQLVSDAGVVMAFGLGASVTAGDSADVSFAPFLRGGTSGGVDALAVHYNTSPQTGTFLESTTSTGTSIENSGSGQIDISSDDGAGSGGFIGISTADGEVFVGSTSIVERLNPSGGAYEIQDHSHGDIVRVDENRYVTIRLGSATEVNILGPFSRKIMKIVDGGGGVPEYHIKTGGAWVADL